MGFVVITPLAALAVWSIIRIFLWVRNGNFSGQWRRACWIMSAVGLLVGVGFAFLLHYQVRTVRLQGFPIPTTIFSCQKLGDPWVEGKIPAAVRVAGKVTNVLSGIALCLAPLAIGAFLKENKGQLEFARPPKTT